MEESIASNSNGALFNGFDDDFVDRILSEIENETNNKSVINGNPGNVAAKQKRECQPWLKQKPFDYQATSGDEAEKAKQKPKLQPSSSMMMNKNTAAAYLQVMEDVANKTHRAFLDQYGDDSVHVKFQELWKLKMVNKKAEHHSVAGSFRAASVANPSHDLNPPYESRRRKGTSAQYKATSITTTAIPLPGESIQYQHLSAYHGNGTHSQSTASIELGKRASYYKKLPSQPWLGNTGFQRAQLNYIVQPAAKKQRLHQPWLKQKPFGYQQKAGLEEARQRYQL